MFSLLCSHPYLPSFNTHHVVSASRGHYRILLLSNQVGDEYQKGILYFLTLQSNYVQLKTLIKSKVRP